MLSVVIAATDSAEAVARAVASIDASSRGEIECIVASSTIAPRDLAGVRWIRGKAGSGVPHLRRLGLDQARGRVVVFTEDSCVFPPGWADDYLDAFADDRTRAASGPVLPPLDGRAIDWAVFFCEYAVFLPRNPHPSTRLAGNNFAIRRDLSSQLDREEIHESEVAATVLRIGCDGFLETVKRPEVSHVRHYGIKEAFRDRFRFGFEFGLRRGRGFAPVKRLAGLIAGPAILAVQVARLFREVGARPHYWGVFVKNLPVTLALLTTWCVGEWLGWSRSAFGPSHSRR